MENKALFSQKTKPRNITKYKQRGLLSRLIKSLKA